MATNSTHALTMAENVHISSCSTVVENVKSSPINYGSKPQNSTLPLHKNSFMALHPKTQPHFLLHGQWFCADHGERDLWRSYLFTSTVHKHTNM